MSKRKILNDPIHGFITIPYEILFQIIDHPFFQRLRRIKQLGLTDYVYPGAVHTRFHHALGAFHLMRKAIYILRAKEQDISKEEEISTLIAILLHDIGHGPYSHTLEQCIISGAPHELISEVIMQKLNDEMGGKLDMAIDIFNNAYPKKFLHQLVSSQLDVDRMDYLARDSVFTGVSEGTISYDRIIEMMDIVNGEIVIESKGIYSIEKFIIARHLMYWQVYLHKTVLCVEEMMIKTFQRARKLASNGGDLPGSRALKFFLKNDVGKDDFQTNSETLRYFTNLDDYDIFAAIKHWQFHDDRILSLLSRAIVSRNLFAIQLQNEAMTNGKLEEMRERGKAHYNVGDEEIDYLVFIGSTSNHAYDNADSQIKILLKTNEVKDIAKASDKLDIKALSTPIVKHFICYPKQFQK